MELERCPYDHTPIEAETMSGGSLLVSCPECGAQWEWHNAWLRRITPPDRDVVTARRAGRAPQRVRPGHAGPVA